MKNFKDLFQRNSYINTKKVMDAIKDGYVRVQLHPSLSIAILNYTEKTQFEQNWNDITCRCRGLVVEWDIFSDKMRVVIESPQKFFNHNEQFAPDLSSWSFDDLWVSEKLDGYYISIRNDSKYGPIITSRGSFNNRYVDAAKELTPIYQLPKDTNYFCELLQDFPGDESIIVTHHPTPKLVCWGVNDEVPTQYDHLGWPYWGAIASQVTKDDLKSYMEQDVEGVVIYNTKTHERVKFKTEWYLDMHRLISDCTFKRALEVVSGGGKIKDTAETTYIGYDNEKHTLAISMLPEEHYGKMCEWENEIWEKYKELTDKVTRDYMDYKNKTPKEYALSSDSAPYVKSLVFRWFKDSDCDMPQAVWAMLRKLLRQSHD